MHFITVNSKKWGIRVSWLVGGLEWRPSETTGEKKVETYSVARISNQEFCLKGVRKRGITSEWWSKGDSFGGEVSGSLR